MKEKMPLPVSGLLAGGRGGGFTLAALDRGRRGKHHEVVQGILGELEPAPVDSPLESPLADVGGIGLPNLRSSVHRAATSQGLTIETLADETNFYVWKTINSK